MFIEDLKNIIYGVEIQKTSNENPAVEMGAGMRTIFINSYGIQERITIPDSGA